MPRPRRRSQGSGEDESCGSCRAQVRRQRSPTRRLRHLCRKIFGHRTPPPASCLGRLRQPEFVIQSAQREESQPLCNLLASTQSCHSERSEEPAFPNYCQLTTDYCLKLPSSRPASASYSPESPVCSTAGRSPE